METNPRLTDSLPVMGGLSDHAQSDKLVLLLRLMDGPVQGRVIRDSLLIWLLNFLIKCVLSIDTTVVAKRIMIIPRVGFPVGSI